MQGDKSTNFYPCIVLRLIFDLNLMTVDCLKNSRRSSVTNQFMNIVITGATKGIGRAIAEAFVSEGHNIAICSRHEKELQDFSVYLLENFPSSKVFYLPADCSKKKQLLHFADFAKSKLGFVDILVNNVGSFIPATIMNEEEGGLEKMMETNVYSAYYLSRFFGKEMIQRKHGHIFNICSISGIKPSVSAGSYSVSKFAMYGLSKVLREELKEYHVKVTTVIPGATITNSWEGTTLPDTRFVKPEDIALAVLTATKLSEGAVVDEIIIKPTLGKI